MLLAPLLGVGCASRTGESCCKFSLCVSQVLIVDFERCVAISFDDRPMQVCIKYLVMPSANARLIILFCFRL